MSGTTAGFVFIFLAVRSKPRRTTDTACFIPFLYSHRNPAVRSASSRPPLTSPTSPAAFPNPETVDTSVFDYSYASEDSFHSQSFQLAGADETVQMTQPSSRRSSMKILSFVLFRF
ncbi:uncharacterized protein LOC125551823 [Triticum urartu]|uniref:uncharacterized protein LOC125551823 n=1 Tax=Triticum urartu TaxID=4572 RepID=UPI0020431C5E|nr:uncharacterized protein LOC125551823 [Triticum urartu]